MADWGTGDDAWNSGGDAGGETWGSGGDFGAAAGGESWGAGDAAGGADDGDDGAPKTCRICKNEGHFARECPDKPEGGGLNGECYNCGEVGHNKADCPNPKVERPFNGTCNLCSEEGHSARMCPNAKCRLCDQTGHKAVDCKSRRIVDWTGVPELEAEDAWSKLLDAGKKKDLDIFRLCLRSYARAIGEAFNIASVEDALRMNEIPIYLIGVKQEVPKNMTIVDMIGNPDREYLCSIQLSKKPRRAKLADGWPENDEENMERLKSSGYLQDRGIPVCSNCGELGHIKKHCKEEVAEHESSTPIISCVYCQEEGHRARDCPKERVNPYACKNCKGEGHTAKECPEPRSAEGVECKRCNETGHFARDCPNATKRTCNNCGSEDHMRKDCIEAVNPDNVQCRNCDKLGHFSKECPEPKDWSKVKCRHCGEMGHASALKCKTPPEGDFAGDGGAVGGGSWDDGNAGGDGGAATSGGWDNDAPTAAAGGESSWGEGGW